MIKLLYDPMFNEETLEIDWLPRRVEYKSRYFWMYKLSEILFVLSIIATLVLSGLALFRVIGWNKIWWGIGAIVWSLILFGTADSIMKNEYDSVKDPTPEYHEEAERQCQATINRISREEPEVLILKKMFENLNYAEIKVLLEVIKHQLPSSKDSGLSR